MNMIRTVQSIAVALAFGGSAVLAAEYESDDAQATYEEIEQTLGLVPSFLEAYPDAGIYGAWEMMKSVQMNPDSALSPKEKELIALAVASQIPCDYCVYFHVQAAEANGATEEEIAETLAMAAAIRHWSTILNGSQTDLDEFKSETDAIMNHLAEQGEGGD